MVTQKEWQNICKLLKLNKSVPEISQRAGRSTTTIYRLLNNGGPKNSERHERIETPKPILKYKKYLDRRLKIGVNNAKKLYAELKGQGYRGSYTQINEYLNLQGRNKNRILKPIFPKKKGKLRSYKPSIRFETQPGEQAQVDWGHFGRFEVNSREEKLSCFIYVLGYSRMMYAEFTIKQNLQTLEQCHIHAFETLGIPRDIVYDNMKTVVLKREKTKNNTPAIYFHPAFLDFAQYYGFKVQPCPPYWPRAKGKIEAGVKYVRNNFMQGMIFKKSFTSLGDLNSKLKIWLENVANTRIHGTTNQRPINLWKIEKRQLVFPKKVPTYAVSPFVVRNSTKDGLIQYKSSFYSVPIQYARKKLLLKEINTNGLVTIEIYHEDKIIAQHKMANQRGQWVINDAHLEKKSQRLQVASNSKNKKKKIAKNPSLIGVRPLSYYDQFILGESKNG